MVAWSFLPLSLFIILTHSMLGGLGSRVIILTRSYMTTPFSPTLINYLFWLKLAPLRKHIKTREVAGMLAFHWQNQVCYFMLFSFDRKKHPNSVQGHKTNNLNTKLIIVTLRPRLLYHFQNATQNTHLHIFCYIYLQERIFYCFRCFKWLLQVAKEV